MSTPTKHPARRPARQPHTPGPWRVCQGTNGFARTWQVEHVTRRRVKVVCDCGPITFEESEANARLIAETPELLSEARDLCQQLEAYTNSDDAELPDGSGLRAALARATGRPA